MQLSDVLTPTPSIGSGNQQTAERVSGRFGYQICADTIAYSQNLPQRLLLIDRLDDLSAVIENLLKTQDIQQILFDGVLSKPIAEGLSGLAALNEISAFRSRLLNLGSNSKFLLLKATEIVCDLALRAQKQSTNTTSEKPVTRRLTQDETDFCVILELLIPHIEQQIWLTEISAPMPAHALQRMHDPWSVYILLWCYKNKTEIRELAQKYSDDKKVQTCSAFDCEQIQIAVFPGWPVCRSDKKLTSQEVIVVVGPCFIKDDIINEEKFDYLAQFFLQFLIYASSELPAWKDASSSMPSSEELLDAYRIRGPIEESEFNLKSKNIVRAWQFLREIEIGNEPIDLKRNDWEALAALSVWLTRWRKNVFVEASQFELGFEDWKSHLTCEISQIDNVFSANFSTGSITNDGLEKLQKEKDNKTDVDLPSVMFNRIRERQTSSWNAQITAIIQLMQRQSTKVQQSRSEQSKNWRSPDWLKGFGSRLCKQIGALAQAHGVTIYWQDYSQEPARLLVIESYSKTYELRAKAEEIHRLFDEEVYQPEDVNSACFLRGQSNSMVYRCVADGLQVVEQFDTASNNPPRAILSAYSKLSLPSPLSKIVLPLTHSGRVLGAMELVGFAQGQFAESIIPVLRRISALISSIIYQTQMLQQMSEINEWAISAPAALTVAKAANSNPLSNLSNKLCNVFLCPMVHIWLRGDDSTKFTLMGSNRDKIFTYGNDSDMRSIRSFSVLNQDQTTSNHDYEYTSDRAFSELALMLWGAYLGKDGKQWGTVPASIADREPPHGLVTQGLFRKGLKNSQADIHFNFSDILTASNEARSVNNFDALKIQAELKPATTRGIVLGEDFVCDGIRSYRNWIFVDEKLEEVAAFALVREVQRTSIDQQGNKIADASSTKKSLEVVGVLTLHDYGDSWLQNHDFQGKYAYSKPATIQKIGGYGAAWMPVISHMQQFLPTVLQQIHLLSNPYDLMRKTFIHEAQHEISETNLLLQRLARQLHQFMGGRGYQGLDQALRQVKNFAISNELQKHLEDAEVLRNALHAASTSTDRMDLIDVMRRLNRLYARLGGSQDFSDFRLPADEPAERIDLFESLQDRTAPYNLSNVTRHRAVQYLIETRMSRELGGGLYSLLPPRPDTQDLLYRYRREAWDKKNAPIIVVRSMWNHVLQNLISNMDKYTPNNRSWSIIWQPREKRLGFLNLGTFDPEFDKPELHKLIEVRGSHKTDASIAGDGLGLSIAIRAAKLLGINVDYSITPSQDSGYAQYCVSLDLNHVWSPDKGTMTANELASEYDEISQNQENS